MRRLGWLLVAVILSASTVGFAPSVATTASDSAIAFNPPAVPAPAPLALAIPGYNAVCDRFGPFRICASVGRQRAEKGMLVTVYSMYKKRGEPVKGKIMTASYTAKGKTSTCTALTDDEGMANCTLYFRGAEKGQKIKVKVTIGNHQVTTYFIAR